MLWVVYILDPQQKTLFPVNAYLLKSCREGPNRIATEGYELTINREKYLNLLKRIVHNGMIKANEHNKVICNVQ